MPQNELFNPIFQTCIIFFDIWIAVLQSIGNPTFQLV